MPGRVPRRIPSRAGCATVTPMNLTGRDAERVHRVEPQLPSVALHALLWTSRGVEAHGLEYA